MSNETPDIQPAGREALLVLNGSQQALVEAATSSVEEAQSILEHRKEILNGLLSMVRPEEADAFNTSTMTFYKE